MKTIKFILPFIVAGLILILWFYQACINWITFWTAIGALGSIFVAIAAIFGNFLRTKFIGPKLEIVPHNLIGYLTTITEYNKITGTPIKSYKSFYYHLKVVNHRPFVPAKNCRVMLRQLHRRGPDGEFHPEALVVHLQYVWSPAESAPALQTVADNEILDFGRISEEDVFRPTLYVTIANFKGFVEPNDAVRFSLQIVADNYVSPKMQIFQVDWNGKWADTTEEMSNNLIISVP